MIKQEKIVKLYKEKINKLINFNKAYFEKDNPIVSDSKFDALKKELLVLAKKYPYLKKIKNIERIIGSKPSNKFKIIADNIVG